MVQIRKGTLVRLLLVRHGQTTSNVRHVIDTADPGAALTDLGREQAKALVGALAEESIDVVIASTLLRAQQTASPIARARDLPLGVRDGIREIGAGDLEMRGDTAASEQYVTTILSWADGDLDPVMPGGGGGRDMLAAFDEVVAEVEASGVATAVLVSHLAAIVTWAVARAANVDTVFAVGHWLPNTGIVILEGSGSHWVVECWSGAPMPAIPLG